MQGTGSPGQLSSSSAAAGRSEQRWAWLCCLSGAADPLVSRLHRLLWGSSRACPAPPPPPFSISSTTGSGAPAPTWPCSAVAAPARVLIRLLLAAAPVATHRGRLTLGLISGKEKDKKSGHRAPSVPERRESAGPRPERRRRPCRSRVRPLASPRERAFPSSSPEHLSRSGH